MNEGAAGLISGEPEGGALAARSEMLWSFLCILVDNVHINESFVF